MYWLYFLCLFLSLSLSLDICLLSVPSYHDIFMLYVTLVVSKLFFSEFINKSFFFFRTFSVVFVGIQDFFHGRNVIIRKLIFFSFYRREFFFLFDFYARVPVEAILRCGDQTGIIKSLWCSKELKTSLEMINYRTAKGLFKLFWRRRSIIGSDDCILYYRFERPGADIFQIFSDFVIIWKLSIS